METISEFLARTAREKQERDVAAAGVVMSTTTRTPDEVAGDLSLANDWAKETGRPVPPMPMVEEYRPVFQQQIEAKRASTILSTNPRLAEFLRDPQNAALARDDISGLSYWERVSKSFQMGDATAITQGKEFSRDINVVMERGAFGQGMDAVGEIVDEALLTNEDGTPNLFGRLANFARSRGMAADGVPRQMVGGPDVTPDERADAMAEMDLGPIYEGATALLAEMDRQQFAPMSYKDVGGLGSGLAFISENLSMSLPQMAAAMSSGALSPLIQVLTLGGEANAELKERTDLPEDQRVAIASGAGVFMAGLDYFGLSRIFGGIPAGQVVIEAVEGTLVERLVQNGVSEAVGRTIQAALAEGTTEALQEGIVVGVTAMSGGEYTAEEVIDRLAQGFFAGAGSGGALRGGVEVVTGGGAAARRLTEDDAKATAATETQARIAEIAQQSAQSKLRARMPDVFRAWVERATEGGPAENLYVPADQFVEYFQGTGLDPFALADEMDGVSRSDLEAALAIGGDLRIPTATYAARLAGSEADAFFMENMRFDPDEFTSAEARAFEDTKAELMAEALVEAERIFAEEQELRTFEEEIYDNMVSRLRMAGRATDVATVEAVLYPAFYRTWAAKTGIPLGEFIQRYPLPQVRGEIPQGMQAREVDDLTRTLAEARAARGAGVNQPNTPLLEFISNYGGIADRGGELAARDAALIRRGPGRSNLRLARAVEDTGQASMFGPTDAGKKYGPDDVANAAIEAGLMADNPVVMEYKAALERGEQVPDITRALWDEIDRELRGEASTTADDMAAGPVSSQDDQISEIERYLAELGVSLDDDDAVIREAVERDRAEQRRMYGQDGQIATDSEAFRKWFGDSKVVGPDGEPLVVYHGTPSDVDGGFAFDLGRVGERDEGFYGRGVYLTPDQEMAESYSSNEDGDVGNTIEAFVSLQNPFVWDARTDESRAATVAALAEMGVRRDVEALSGADNDSLANSDERRKFNAAVRAAGYDGVMVYSKYGDGETPSEIIAFTPTQIKSVNNRGTFDANDPRILYQGERGEIAQPLYVVHNLSAEKLRYANELGGLAAPSLAVARGDIGFDNFGEISLIGDPSMANPKGRGVRAFNADVYSPRQPRARFKVKERDAQRVFTAVREVSDDLGFMDRLDADSLKRDGMSSITASTAIKAAWLKSQGEDLPIQYRDPDPAPVPVEGYEVFTSTDPRELVADPAFREAVQVQNERFIADREGVATPEQIENLRARIFDEDGRVYDGSIKQTADGVARRNRQIAEFVPQERGDVDQYRTSVATDEQIAGREDQYSEWVRSQFGDVIGDAYFEDARGRQRDYTMANLVREMTRGLRDAEGFNYGVGNVRATVAPEFRAMAEIKAARGQIVSEQAMDALKTEVGDELFALADKFAPYHSSGQSFGWGDIFSEFLKDMGKGRRFVEEWQAGIFSEPVPDALLAEAAAYLQKLRDLPTEYFEIKMQRAVGLDEFKVALVPEKASEATVKTLTDAGLEVLRYGVEGRQAALQRVAGKVFFQPAYHGTPHLFERFSLDRIGTGEGAQAFGWGLYFAGRKAVAEYYREALNRGRSEQVVATINGKTFWEWKWLKESGLDEDWFNTWVARPIAFGEAFEAQYPVNADYTAIARLRAMEARSNQLGAKKKANAARRLIDLLENGKIDARIQKPGRLFEVNIPEDSELLDWDAPLSEQPEAVREKLQPMLDRVREIDRAFIADQRQAEREAATSAPISDEMAALLDDLDLPDVSPEEQAATDAAAAAREAERVERLLNLKWGDSKKVMGLHAELAGFFAENDAAWSLIGKTPDDVMNTQQAASELLRDAGIPGHRYLDGGSRADGDGSYNYVIYDDSRIDVVRFEQEQRGSIAFPGAGVGNGDTVVNLFRKADLSTFLHESGHYFLTVMQDMAARGEASAATEFETVKQWWRSNAADVAKDAMRVMPDVTVTDADVIQALDNGTTGDTMKDAAIDVGMQEQFARGFEAYLMDGKAPSVELRTAFEKFRAWLLSVYRSLRGLNVEIDDNIRGVFDRMIATDEQIAEARAQTGDRGPMFSEAPAGMSAEDWSRYQAIGQAAQDEAAARLLAETMAPIRREEEKKYRAEKEAVRAEVERGVNARREYRAIEWMGNRRWLGDEKPMGLADMRLDRQTLVDRYGEGVLKTLPRGKFTIYANEGGVDPEIAAGLFGFGSADEMIRALERAPKRAEAISAEVEKVMFERHGDPLRDGTVEAKAIEAVHGDKRARMLALELDVLRAAPGGTKSAVSVFREMARQTLTGMRVRDAMAANRYLTAERKAGEAAYRASANGDMQGAADAKRRQLLNHMLYTEAKKIEAEVEAAEKLAARLQKKSTREKLAGDYLEAIDEILGRYDFRRLSGRAEDRRGALAAFVERMTAEGRENELAIPERVLQDAQRTPYKRLTVEHLRGVVDSLKNIEHTARLKQKLIDAQSQRDLDAVVEDILGSFDANVKPQPPGRVGTTGEKLRGGARAFLDLVLNAATLLREIDGFNDLGPAFSNLKAPIDQAMNRLQARREKAAVDLDALYDVYGKDERRKMAVREFVPEIGDSLSKWERISVALNMGNEGNYQRLTDTKVKGGFTEAQVKAIVAGLDERDARFVQSVWDYVGSFYPDIDARERRVTGVGISRVEARPVVIAGVELRGGYYPLKYDARLSPLARDDAAQDIAASLQAGRYGKAQTKNGHLKERAQSSGRPVELDISVLHRHVQQVVYDLELSEPVSNSWRILQDGRIRDAFVNAGKQVDFDALETWLKDAAEGELRSADVASQAFRRAKSNFTAAKLAFNLSTVAVQITGVAQSMVVVGKRDFLSGVQASFRPGIREEVFAKSLFMRERSTTFNKDIFDLYNDPKIGPVASRWTEIRNDWIAPAGFWLMTKVQSYLVDVPTWLGGYQQGLRKFGNDEAKAVAYADDIVKRSQASGLFTDRSAVERGSASGTRRQSDFLRLFTTLGSYMFAKFNVAYERTGRARQVIGREGLSLRSAQEAVSWTIDVAFLFTLEAVLYAAIKGRLPDEEDDEDGDGMTDEWAAYLAKETALSFMSTMPFVRDIGSVLTGFGGGGAYGAITEELARPLVQAGQGEADLPFVKSVINATGLFTGLPSGQINRAVDAGWRQAQGEDVSPAEYLLGRMGN